MRFWLPRRIARRRQAERTFDPNAGIGTMQCPECGGWLKTRTRFVKCPWCLRELEAPRVVQAEVTDTEDLPETGRASL